MSFSAVGAAEKLCVLSSLILITSFTYFPYIKKRPAINELNQQKRTLQEKASYRRIEIR